MPSSNTIIEPDFYTTAPKGVTIHSARMKLLDFNPQALLNMINDVSREASYLASAEVNIMIYGCSTCSLLGGIDWEKVLVNQIMFETGIKVVTINQAVVEAIRRLRGRKIGVVTPYDENLNCLERDYLKANGITVSSCKGLGLHNPLDIAKVETDEILKIVDEVTPGCDTLYIGCTNLPVIHLIEGIESEFGLPVVTSNQAAIWYALRGFKITGYGQLFMK